MSSEPGNKLFQFSKMIFADTQTIVYARVCLKFPMLMEPFYKRQDPRDRAPLAELASAQDLDLAVPEPRLVSSETSPGNCPDFAHPVDRTTSKTSAEMNVLFLSEKVSGVFVIDNPREDIKATRRPYEVAKCFWKYLISLGLTRENSRKWYFSYRLCEVQKN